MVKIDLKDILADVGKETEGNQKEKYIEKGSLEIIEHINPRRDNKFRVQTLEEGNILLFIFEVFRFH